ncbi:MAG: hypothetical protein J6B87_02895 [Clostridia bacterium]|nr:hypothetical protein [Clostridia bacterium]
MKIKIIQPQGKIIVGKNGIAKLEWNPGFQQKYQGIIDNAQKFVDSECIKRMAPYTPFLTGMLEKSATLGTVIGSGYIKQIAPYARYLYYGKLMVSSLTGSAYANKGEKKILTNIDLNYNKVGHRFAGPFWFDNMKADNWKSILKGAQKYIDRG